jgi:hypothetical protein
VVVAPVRQARNDENKNGLEHIRIGFIDIALKPSNSKGKVSTERKVFQHR